MLTRNDVSVIREFYCDSNLEDVDFDYAYCREDVVISYYQSSRIIVVPYDDFMGVITSVPTSIDDAGILQEFGVNEYDRRFSKLAFIKNNLESDGVVWLFEAISELFNSLNLGFAKTPQYYYLMFPKEGLLNFKADDLINLIQNQLGEWMISDCKTDFYGALHKQVGGWKGEDYQNKKENI